MHDYKIYGDSLRPCKQSESHRDRFAASAPGIMAAGKAIWTCGRRWKIWALTTAAKAIGLRVQGGHALAAGAGGVHEFASKGWRNSRRRGKRQVLEYQLKEQLYNWKETCARRWSASSTPRANGRPHGDWLLPRRLS